jgi:hypothetical protein
MMEQAHGEAHVLISWSGYKKEREVNVGSHNPLSRALQQRSMPSHYALTCKCLLLFPLVKVLGTSPLT